MMREIVGNIIIGIGIVFVLLGVLGIYRFKDFYSRILIGAKVDTVGFITICTGAIIRSGFTWFSLKVLLLVAIVMLINPVVTHAIASSAYRGGYRVSEEDDNNDAGS
ncbi:MAG: monovalent cation/H(+) antiporter subunit G [Clostridia bacterium]|nr:monovalent cation/H(+) antiporter subunit G [Clostridia bacterium]MBN2883655.1 monovalent cation/H(+) antiporter subunit G [Clostridia bacterium]